MGFNWVFKGLMIHEIKIFYPISLVTLLSDAILIFKLRNPFLCDMIPCHWVNGSLDCIIERGV